MPKRSNTGFLLAACLPLLQGCLFSTSSYAPAPPLDAPFRIGSVDFPNDTAFARAFPETPVEGRMTRFLQKCRAGGAVRIGFMGGSITEGAGASARTLRYSTLFTRYVQELCPALDTAIELNEGIGATGSRYAASRVADDLLSNSPDLVVIEFAVNDFGADPDSLVRATLEGLVRRIGATDAAMMLVFTAKGDLRNVQDLHAPVGAHYGLPRVSYRDAIRPLLDSGRIAWSDVFIDDPHPNDKGHRLIAHLMAACLRKLSTLPAAAPAQLPPALFEDLYAFAGAMKPGDSAVTATGGWTRVAGEGGRHAWVAPAGDSVTLVLRTRKRELTLGIHVQPHDTSSVRVSVDGGPSFTVNNHFVFEYARPRRVFLFDSAAERTVRITHARGPRFRLDYVLHAGEPE